MKKHTFLTFLLIIFLTSCGSNQDKKTSSIPTDLATPTPEMSPSPLKEHIKSDISKKTVLITGKGTGTGIIIGHEGSKYYILTSKHVVGIEPSIYVELPPDLTDDEKKLTNKEDPYKVMTYDGKIYDVEYNELKKDPNVDLAIITFDTKSQGTIYPIANLAALPISEKQEVFVYGFKDCANKGRKKREEFNEGIVLSTKNTQTDEGYSINYTNPTIRGMSGSPVLDASGRVIAVHGKPSNGEKGEFFNCSALTKEFGNNYGISIESFQKSKLASSFPGKLSFDSKPLEEILLAPPSTKPDKLEQSPSPSVRFKKSQN